MLINLCCCFIFLMIIFVFVLFLRSLYYDYIKPSESERYLKRDRERIALLDLASSKEGVNHEAVFIDK